MKQYEYESEFQHMHNNQFCAKRCNEIQFCLCDIGCYISSLINSKDKIALIRNGNSEPLYRGDYFAAYYTAQDIRVSRHIFKHAMLTY